MTYAVVGLDTSNYRTSVAAVSLSGNVLLNRRELLTVSDGQRGLRQSEAVFAHLKQFCTAEQMIRENGSGFRISAVAASVSPRDGESSYMPVFQVGTSFGRMMAALLGVPFFATTHQRGHLAAAVAGTCLEKKREMLALHLSGGTTDLLLVQDGRPDQIGGSLDLHAGQLVDRVGVALGLPFPAGPLLEKMASGGISQGMLGCSMANGDLNCHFSGAEAQVMRWINTGMMCRENIAREVYDMLARTISRLVMAGIRETGIRQVLITGGVASSVLLREMLNDRLKRNNAPEPVYGKPELSGDNAVGVALIGLQELRKKGSLLCLE